MTEPNKYEMKPSAQPSTYDGSQLAVEPQDTTQTPTQQDPTRQTPPAPQPPAPPDTTVSGAPRQSPTTPQLSPTAITHAGIFDKILKGLSGGDIKVVNPDGSVRVVQQSRSAMGKSIVAAALAGLMTPTKYRETPYGPATDFNATGAAAAQNAQAEMDKRRNAPQQLSDEQQARRLKFLENNSRLFNLQMASAAAKHSNWEQQQKDAAPFVDTIHQYDQDRPDDPSVPKGFLYEGMTHDEAMNVAKQPGSGITENNFIPDGGWRPVTLPDGKTEMEPTYAILNPALQNLKITPEIAAKLQKVSPQWDDLTKRVGGPANIPQSMWVHAMHDYATYNSVNNAMNRLNKTLNGKDAKDIDISETLRANKRLLPAMDKIIQGLTHPDNGLEAGENPANMLDNVMKFAPDFLKLLGLNGDSAFKKVTDLTAERAEAMARAKNAGTAKEEADPAMVAGLKVAAATLTPDQQKNIMPTLNQDVITKREAEKIQADIKGYQTSNQGDETRRLLAGGDPTEIAKFAHNVTRGDLNSIDKLPSRGDARIKAMNAAHDEAAQLGLDTTKYTDSYLQTKIKMQDDYNSRNRKTTGAQLGSFDAYLGHTAAAADALDALKSETIGLTRQPLINEASDTIGKQLTNDTNWKRWETALVPVRNEIENFLAAGYKPSEAEQGYINQVLDKHETPARIMAAITQLADTADIRLASLGKGYTDTMDSNFRGLLSPDAANSLKRLGIKSKAAAYSGVLNKGWDAQGNMQNLTDIPLAKRFVAAAGGDRQRAVELARANGWILQ
jgi:hypothetical protein